MRIVQKFLPGVIAIAALAACDIPDDGYNELKGEILIPTAHLPLVVQPADEGSDCNPETEKGWGEFGCTPCPIQLCPCANRARR